MSPLVLYVLVVTSKPKTGAPGIRAFVDPDGFRLRELGEELIQNKPEEVLEVSYELVPAEGIPTTA